MFLFTVPKSVLQANLDGENRSGTKRRISFQFPAEKRRHPIERAVSAPTRNALETMDPKRLLQRRVAADLLGEQQVNHGKET
ncbi:hypothetical protein GWC77_12045 [Paraburkholderia sp. NMBU_R16]|uniref:hypothetical protein n=1 Tax=Paraburkholderia sp. NMBU_R16 TaxID=2698676 RepID=UPI001565D7DF|nr:hypothetical protein [Paraburkholderia sp. NMBU_R16]NRO96655.1 hypothetical protein [Paraburkholderia sp. NMBU_R16]